VLDPDVTAAPLRVLVVDADERVRDSLCGLLCIGERCAVVGSAADPDEALTLARTSSPDVVIVDPRLLPPDGGRAFIAGLRQLKPSIRVIAMSRSDDGTAAALAAGVDAVVHKTFRARELVDAVLTAGRIAAS
jgi:DNA-binding NarL/FixJ family response regulator